MTLVKHLLKRKKQFVKGMNALAGVDQASDQRKLGTYEELYPNASQPTKKKKKKGK
jgi:hypothetical protein